MVTYTYLFRNELRLRFKFYIISFKVNVEKMFFVTDRKGAVHQCIHRHNGVSCNSTVVGHILVWGDTWVDARRKSISDATFVAKKSYGSSLGARSFARIKQNPGYVGRDNGGTMVEIRITVRETGIYV